MRFVVQCGFVFLALVATSGAKELPEAPSSSAAHMGGPEMAQPASTSVALTSKIASLAKHERSVFDKRFLGLAVVTTGSTFADSYTTLFARENWLAGKQGVCNMEVESAYLYGTHPTVARTYAVASVKSAASVFAAYYLRKHRSRFWSLPLVATSIMSLQGVGQNLANCN